MYTTIGIFIRLPVFLVGLEPIQPGHQTVIYT